MESTGVGPSVEVRSRSGIGVWAKGCCLTAGRLGRSWESVKTCRCLWDGESDHCCRPLSIGSLDRERRQEAGDGLLDGAGPHARQQRATNRQKFSIDTVSLTGELTGPWRRIAMM